MTIQSPVCGSLSCDNLPFTRFLAATVKQRKLCLSGGYAARGVPVLAPMLIEPRLRMDESFDGSQGKRP